MGKLAGVALAVLCLLIGSVPGLASDVPQADLIKIRTPVVGIQLVAVNARLINEGEVDTTVVTTTTSGLHVVPVGLPVYVAASEGNTVSAAHDQPEESTVIVGTGFAWSVTGPSGTTAAIADAAEVGKQFTPDMVGDYVVTLVLSHEGGDTTLTKTVTAAKYVGYEACFGCHTGMNPGLKESWMATGHAKMLQRGLSGTLSSHYNEGCVKCHSVSANRSVGSAAVADNDGFEDVAAELGWTFPADLMQGSWVQSDSPETPDALSVAGWNLDLEGEAWEDLPPELKKLAGIQCETCHGPGGTHATTADVTKIGKSLDNGVCAQCHDDGHYHVRPHEWDNSGHAKLWSRNSTSCSPCHLGSGYLVALEEGLNSNETGVWPASGSFELGVTQTCATCHDPHAVANDKQVRVVGNVSIEALVPGSGVTPQTVTADMGTGAMCGQCHNMRAGRNTVDTSLHHSGQTEMLLGVGGYHYEGETYSSGSHKNIENTCAACHMSAPPSGAAGLLGSHSWNMHNAGADSISGTADDLYNTTGCASCHGPLDDFNVNGAQTEIHELTLALIDVLPNDDGEPYTHDNGGHGSAPDPMTDTQLQAAWNAAVVDFDGSGGVHNFVYARKLLVDALQTMGGVAATPVQGDFDGNGKVDFADMFQLIAAWGTSTATEGFDAQIDLSGNGAIGYTDWLMFVEIFGQQTGSAKPLPLVDNGINVDARFGVMGSNRKSIDSEHMAVTLTAQNVVEMRGYGLEITFDAENLEFVRAIPADNSIMPSTGGPTVFVKELSEGRLLVSDGTVGDNFASGSGTLVDLVFKLNGPAGDGSIAIDLAQVADLNFGINRPSGVEATPAVLAFDYALGQNFPNPFNPSTSIRYSLAEAGTVRIVVYNSLGQEVRTLVDNTKLAGDYTANWDARDAQGRDVASGIYLYQMEVNGFTASQRMVLMR